MLSTNVGTAAPKPASAAPPTPTPAPKAKSSFSKRVTAVALVSGSIGGSVGLGKYLDENRDVRTKLVTSGGPAGEAISSFLVSSYATWSEDIYPVVWPRQTPTRAPTTASPVPPDSIEALDQVYAPVYRIPQKSSSPKSEVAAPPAVQSQTPPAVTSQPVPDDRERLIENNRAALERQAKELEAKFQQELIAAKQEVSKEAELKLQGALESLRQDSEKRREADVNAALATSAAAFNEERAEVYGQLEHLRALAVKAEDALDTAVAYHQQGHTAHLLALALESFDEVLEGQAKLSACLSRVQKASPEIGSVLSAAVRGDKSDILTRAQLSERFQAAAERGRQVGLVPEDSGIWGEMLASVTTKLKVKQTHIAPPASDKSTEAVITRAEIFMENDNLFGAVCELRDLEGKPLSAVNDWLNAAEKRLAVELARDFVRAEALVYAERLS